MNQLIYGIHSVSGMMKRAPNRIICVFILNKPLGFRLKLLVNQIEQLGLNKKECDCKWMNNKVHGAVHQGVIAQIVSTPVMNENDLFNIVQTYVKRNLLLLILDGITDPQNLGACFRTAYAAGVHAIVVPRNRSVCVTGVVSKVASGAVEFVPFIRVTNLVRILKLLKQYNIWIVGTVMKSDRCIFYSELVGSIALVMGSEGRGIRYLTQKHCDELVCIPMSSCTVESLNVSVATGICLFEILRKRKYS